MRSSHLIIGATSIVAICVAVTALLVDPGYFVVSSAALTGFGLVVAGLTGLVGLLLARAPWGRWTLLGIVTLSLLCVTGSDGILVWIAFGIGGVAIVGLLGPWLRLWTRHQPITDGPGTVPLILMAVAPGAALVVGVCGIDGVGAVDWLVVATSIVSSVLYGRGSILGRWLLRTAVPLAGALAAGLDGDPGSWVVLAATVGVAILAWSPQATRVTAVITPPLPPPVPRKAQRT